MFKFYFKLTVQMKLVMNDKSKKASFKWIKSLNFLQLEINKRLWCISKLIFSFQTSGLMCMKSNF